MGLGKGNYMNQAKNLLTFLEKHVQDRPHDPFLHAKKNSNYEAITFLSLYQSIAQLSAALSEMGISNNDKVAILSNNRPEWVMTDLDKGAPPDTKKRILPPSLSFTFLKTSFWNMRNKKGCFASRE